jgi:outer membrane receptor protein involved in Fe transport
VPLASAISAILAGVPMAHAQQAQQAQATGGLEEVIVTAQKVSENLQSVPISIQVLNNEKLEQLHIASMDDYVKYMPTVSYVRSQGQGGNGGPGESHVYMRGIVSGGDGNHSGSQPSVGTYLDEQPVTTIDGTVDVHIYDIERIEVLAGPQGTLYGASSQAGTIRIITNKPDPSKFSASYDLSVNSVAHGGVGYTAEGYVNLPLSPIAAIRLVAWDEHDAGYISNVAGTNAAACIVNGVRTFPTWAGAPAGGRPPAGCPPVAPLGAGAISNAAYVKDNYNYSNTKGGRGALRVLMGDNWTITPTIMGQTVYSNGFFGYDPAVGDLKVTHFGPENSSDAWMQAALTAEGKISDFDIVYAGAYMKRTTHTIADYSDYSEFYDRAFGSGTYWRGNNGQVIMPQELVSGRSYFTKISHELRVSTPQNLPVRATAGLFMERQVHDIWQNYVMPGYNFTNPYGFNPNGLATSLSIPGLDNSIWLTDEQRVDRDQAAFAQVTWQIFDPLSVSAGIRYFKSDNTLQGFFGYARGYPFSSGEKICFEPATVLGAPCNDLDKRIAQSGTVPRFNAEYKFDPDHMIYATYSRGFRPGGVNRTALPGIGPYQPDYLTNYEIGWKIQSADHRFRWNGAVFEEDWKNFQFAFLGLNSVTVIANGGSARVRGVESEFTWAPTGSLLLTSGVTFIDPILTTNYCAGQGVTECPGDSQYIPFLNQTLQGPLAPKGTNLPVAPKFKGNMVARYTFGTASGWEPFAQAAWVYQTQTTPLLRVDNVRVVGNQPAYGLVDLAAGVNENGTMIELALTNAFDRRAQLTRFVQCTVDICNQPYIIPTQPRTIALKFGQKF